MNNTRLFNIIAIIVFLVILKLDVFSQPANVGIGTNNPDESAILDLYSTTKGLLIPRLSTTARDNLSKSNGGPGPAKGLLIYNLSSNVFQFNSGDADNPVWTTLNFGENSWALDNGKIFVGDGSNLPIGVTLSGDATLSNTGVLTISDDAVDGTDINLSGNTIGDMMYFDGNNWVRLSLGTDGLVLSANTTTNAPEYRALTLGDLPAMTDNQLIIGSTGNAPLLRTLTAGDGIDINIDASNITITAESTLPETTIDNSTLRWNDATSEWQVNTLVKTTSANLIVGDNATSGTLQVSDGSNHTATILSASLSANRIYTIPEVGTNADFVMTAGNQTIAGDKTFSGTSLFTGQTSFFHTSPTVVRNHLNITNNNSTANELRLFEPNNGSEFTSFKSPALTANVNYTLPADDGSLNSTLMSDGAGVLSWKTGYWNMQSITSGTTLDNDDFVVITNFSSTQTIILPSASQNAGKVFIIRRRNSSVIIDPAGSEQIEGSDNYTISNAWNGTSAATIISDGTGWRIIQRY